MNQRTVGRQMTYLLRNHFLLSKEAADPNEVSDSKPTTTAMAEETTPTPSPSESPDAAAVNAKEAAPNYSQIEIGFFELSRENLQALAGKILRDDGDWHVVFFDDAKSVESLQAAARKLPGTQERALQKETGNTEIDAGDIEPDLQGPYLAVGVDLVKNENMHWALDLQLPPLAPPGTRALAQASAPMQGSATTAGTASAAATAPSAGAAPMLPLITLEGNVHFTPQSALMLVYDPAVRNFNLEREHTQLAKSPLKVLASDDFRMGYSALVVWVRLK